jgi:hypothetical protein
MEPMHGCFAANVRHDTLRAGKVVCLTLKLLQLKETNPSHGPNS